MGAEQGAGFLLLTWGLFRPDWLGTPGIWWPDAGWRWWGPLPALAAFALLTSVGPVAGQHPDAADYPDPALLAIGATVTFLTANVTEELFYRVILQTRLEAVLGRWAAIVSTALLFALLHLPTHGQTGSALGGLPLTLAAIVVFQGTTGVFLGYLWSRYRNVWAQITAHTIINTLPLVFL
ncbi:CPBP family intramembrane glutamic endopeptidase [Luedemannella flava]